MLDGNFDDLAVAKIIAGACSPKTVRHHSQRFKNQILMLITTWTFQCSSFLGSVLKMAPTIPYQAQKGAALECPGTRFVRFHKSAELHVLKAETEDEAVSEREATPERAVSAGVTPGAHCGGGFRVCFRDICLSTCHFVMLCCIMLCHVMSCYVMSCYVMFC